VIFGASFNKIQDRCISNQYFYIISKVVNTRYEKKNHPVTYRRFSYNVNSAIVQPKSFNSYKNTGDGYGKGCA